MVLDDVIVHGRFRLLVALFIKYLINIKTQYAPFLEYFNGN